jgi:RNA polymerase sigma-70 factor (ECF subfamily)
MFGVPFDEIAGVVDRSPAAARQLASRARRRVRGSSVPDRDVERQQEVVKAFMAASRDGDLEALVELLDPQAIMRVDVGSGPRPMRLVRGAEAIAKGARAFGWRRAPYSRTVLVNGAPGILVADGDQPLAVLDFTIADGKIIEIDILADTARLRELDLPGLDR